MNRKDRRKLIKKGVTANDLKTLYNNTKETSIHFTTSAYSAAVALVLHDKFGFGEVRLKRALSHIEDTFESINEGNVKIDDIKRTILEECKIDLKL